jgi:hypothetical protein
LRNVYVEGEWIKKRLVVKNKLISLEKEKKNDTKKILKEEINEHEFKKLEIRKEKNFIDELISYNVISWRDNVGYYTLVCIYSQFQLGFFFFC